MTSTESGSLQGRVAVITGAASGMGLATARRFIAEGASVVLADLNEVAGREAAAALGERARFERCDVSVEDNVAAAIDAATQVFGRLDVMFNNAGVGGAFGPVTEISVEDWDATFHVLVRGVFLGTKYAARQMIAQGDGGSIINTASVAALSGGGGPQAYSAAKAAVINLTSSTAIELATHSIRVNAICPGIIFTPLMHRGAEDEAEAVMRELQPWPHRGEGSDIAGTALWLAGPDSAFVTGSSIVVDGGISAAGTRLYGKLGGTEHLDSITGIAHGTTGRPSTVRRL
jgi:NAD(P)-dependent dehydrogenase (short-subunit alcohol dehydrogenase family)